MGNKSSAYICAVRQPDDQVPGVKQYSSSSGGFGGGDVVRGCPKSASLGSNKVRSELLVTTNLPEELLVIWAVAVRDPHVCSLRDVVVPYADVRVCS